jgi:hypothetical protein
VARGRLAGERRAQELAADPEVKALAKGPGNPTGKNRNGDDVTNLKGNSASYLVRRLKRDRPDIADALARGEYKSARAAGIVRVPTPVEIVRRAWKRTSPKARPITDTATNLQFNGTYRKVENTRKNFKKPRSFFPCGYV